MEPPHDDVAQTSSSKLTRLAKDQWAMICFFLVSGAGLVINMF